jgi:hypothetical protein
VTRWVRTVVVALGCSVVFATSAAAQWYVLGVPEPARVIAGYDGPDIVDRSARQIAALRVIRIVIMNLSWDRVARDRESGRPYVNETPDERRLREAFGTAERLVPLPAFVRGGAPARQWSVLIDKYAMGDEQFQDDVIHRFFPPEWVKGYLAAKARDDAFVAARKRKTDSSDAARSLQEVLAARPPQPVQPAQRSFALGLHVFCRHFPGRANDPPPSEEATGLYMQRLDTLARRFPRVTDWSGTIENIVRRSDTTFVTITVDTVSRYVDEERVVVGLVDARFTEGTPIAAAVSRLQSGQLVYFSGRLLEPAEDASVNLEAEEVAGCRVSFTLELTAIRPVS